MKENVIWKICRHLIGQLGNICQYAKTSFNNNKYQRIFKWKKRTMHLNLHTYKHFIGQLGHICQSEPSMSSHNTSVCYDTSYRWGQCLLNSHQHQEARVHWYITSLDITLHLHTLCFLYFSNHNPLPPPPVYTVTALSCHFSFVSL